MMSLMTLPIGLRMATHYKVYFFTFARILGFGEGGRNADVLQNEVQHGIMYIAFMYEDT